jgi:hypothetical protein
MAGRVAVKHGISVPVVIAVDEVRGVSLAKSIGEIVQP